MFISTQHLLNEITQKPGDPSSVLNPLAQKYENIRLYETQLEERIQDHISTIFKDKKYYQQFEAVLPAPSTNPAPIKVVDPREKALQNHLTRIESQQKTQALTPARQKTLEEKKLEIEAALEKMRIDSEERVANARIASDEKHGLKRTIAGGLAGGLGGGAGAALIGGLGIGASKLLGRFF